MNPAYRPASDRQHQKCSVQDDGFRGTKICVTDQVKLNSGFILIFTVSAPGQLLLSIVWAQYMPPLLILMVGVLRRCSRTRSKSPSRGQYIGFPWQIAVSGLRLKG